VQGTLPTGKQHGGRMGFGEVAVVGEAGPEIFVAPASGRIIPHGQAMGRTGNVNYQAGGGTWITQNFYSAASVALGMAMVHKLKRQRINASMGG